MASKTYLEHLAKVPLFTTCNRKELQKIARAADEVEIDAGRALVEQGAAGHEAFVIIEGQAVVRRNDQDVATLGPGQAFGELAILDGGPRPAAIIGCPVGFIGAAESKDALASFADDHGVDVPFVTVRGRRGGSAMASSAINALAQEEE